jgi:polysaccharide biosynthesis protein PslE
MKAHPEWLASANNNAPEMRSTPLRDILTQAFRDRWRIGLTFGACMLLTVLAAMLPSKKYTSEASLLLRLGREYIYTPEVGDPQSSSPIAYDREQILLAEAKILGSRDLKDAVLNKLGVLNLYPNVGGLAPDRQRDTAVQALDKALQAELLKGSNLLQMSFTHKDPVYAAKVLEALIDAYLAKRSVIFASASSGTAENDFGKRKQELEEVERRLSALKGDRRIRAFGEEQTLLLAQRNAIELKLADASQQSTQSASRTSALRAGLSSVSSDVMLSSETQRSEAAESARRTLLDLRLKERDLTSKFAADHPTVVDVQADINRTQDFLKDIESKPTSTRKVGRNPARDAVETDLLRSQAEQKQAEAGATQLQRQRVEIDTRLKVLAESERDLQMLERERRLAEQNYEAASKRLRDETAVMELDRKRRSNVSIVQPPLVPVKGTSLAPMILAIGTVLSLCAALLVAFLSALWRDTFLSPEQVERELGIPVLAAVPEAAA